MKCCFLLERFQRCHNNEAQWLYGAARHGSERNHIPCSAAALFSSSGGSGWSRIIVSPLPSILSNRNPSGYISKGVTWRLWTCWETAAFLWKTASHRAQKIISDFLEVMLKIYIFTSADTPVLLSLTNSRDARWKGQAVVPGLCGWRTDEPWQLCRSKLRPIFKGSLFSHSFVRKKSTQEFWGNINIKDYRSNPHLPNCSAWTQADFAYI